MDDDNSNDVVLVENTEDEDSRPSTSSSETRPLLSLFERLISNDSKSNTVLTNAQILSILVKEFNMDVTVLHELEVEIYINIVKKFLKDWPQWDNFDRLINKMKKKSAHDVIKGILETKYKHLKEYLQSMIEAATPLAQDAVKKLKIEQDKPTDSEISDIVLEIYCTRRMLNSFIYNKPHPMQNNTLFNLVDFEPYQLDSSLPFYTFKSLLHWFSVSLTIDLPSFQFTRTTAHKLSHVLVNEENGPRRNHNELDTNVYMKNTPSITTSLLISSIVAHLDKLLVWYRSNIEYDMVREILDVVKSDLVLDSPTIEIPGQYKQQLSKYPYIRKLYSDVDVGQPPKHNMFIEETIIPIQDWQLTKFISMPLSVKPQLQSWLKFECFECKQRFNGAEFLTLLRDHFKVYHVDEPDWVCSNCERPFKMADLTREGWRHEC